MVLKKRITKKVTDRRANVLLYCIKGYTAQAIAKKLHIDRGTVKNDLTLLLDDVIDWTENLALLGWLKKVEDIYTDSCNSINHINTQQEQIRNKKSNKNFSFVQCPFIPQIEEQKDDYFKWLSEFRKAQSAFYHKPNQYSEYAQLENAKTKTTELLIELTTHIPLFAATQRLAIYYQKNKQLQLS